MSELSSDIKREIGQHFIFGFDGYEPTEGIIKLIQEHYVGAVILFKRNVKSVPQVHTLIQSLQKAAHSAGHAQPLLIGIDQENGLVSAFSSTPTTSAGTQFPGAMALGSSGSPVLAAETTAASAREMKMVGINWAFSPVADINSDPRNPVIGVRSFGEDPSVVSTFATTVASALASEGIAPCAKHFPGHGDTHVDSHLSLPVIHKSLSELRETELVPFSALAAASTSPIASIMTAHIALPLLHTPAAPSQNTIPTTPKAPPPASLSRLISTNLLRSSPPAGLGYSGVCVTDCLEMNAISEGVGVGPGAVAAINAGADVVMICHRMDRQMAALESVYESVKCGISTDVRGSAECISLEELKASGDRIRELKDRFAGSWEDVLDHRLELTKFESLQAQNKTISLRAYRQTTRWLSPATANSQGFLSKDERIFVMTPAMERINPAVDEPEPTTTASAGGEEGISKTTDGKLRNTAGPSYISFARALETRLPKTSHLVYTASDSSSTIRREALTNAVVSAQSIIFTTRNAHQTSSAWQISVLRRVLKEIRDSGGNAKVVVLASCAPYDYASLQQSAETKDLPVLCTYEFTKEALEAAAHVLSRTD